MQIIRKINGDETASRGGVNTHVISSVIQVFSP